MYLCSSNLLVSDESEIKIVDKSERFTLRKILFFQAFTFFIVIKIIKISLDILILTRYRLGKFLTEIFLKIFKINKKISKIGNEDDTVTVTGQN